jgi:hypothetical protein
MTEDIFQIAIRAYLDALAKHDEQFAIKYKNESKSVAECCTYILNQVKKSNRIGFDDPEIFGMAVHYYDEADIPQEDLKPVGNCRAVINTKLEKPKPQKTESKKSEKKGTKAEPKSEAKKAIVTKPITPAKATPQPKAKKPVESKQMDLFGGFEEFNPFK